MKALLIWIVLLYRGQTADAEKRILLSDPSYVHQLEVKLQELTAKVDLVTSINQQLTAKVDNVISSNQQMTAKMNQLTAEVDLVTSANQQLTTTVKNLATGGSGGLYTRWGRTSCPNTTDLVYQGYAGGSWFGYSGAAANHVCMPSDPQYETNALIGPESSHIYGTEYQNVFFGRATVDDDVPCAVCRSTARSSVLMIPGRNTCYQGWTHEYGGYLASGAYSHKAATEYICLDHDPEAVPHGATSTDGALLYYVSSKCGSLACPPYVDSKTLSCVVCSK